MDYHSKYLKYKEKYLKLKNGGGLIEGGGDLLEGGRDLLEGDKNKLEEGENMDFFFNFNEKKPVILNNYEKFNNLSLIETPMKKIGKASANGFIYKIKFNNSNKTDSFNTILKTSIEKSSDNNYYEYVVGNCINKIKEYFPNFVYTFNYLVLNDSLKKQLNSSNNFVDLPTFINNANIKNINLNEMQNNINIGQGCQNNNRASVLIEYIPNSLSLGDLTKNPYILSSINNLNTELYNILFQIYATLSALKEIYTHYDLHTDNVMFIEIPEGKKIKIDYKLHDKTVSIYTSFVPVILDYGRSFINCLGIDQTIYSKIFSEVVCNNPNCNSLKHPECSSRNVGLVIDRNKDENYSKQDDFYYINLRNKNESFDLRYLHNLMLSVDESLLIKKAYKKYFDKETNWVSKDMFGKIKSDKNGTPIINYGVKEDLSDITYTGKISNTDDCFRWLLSIHSTFYTTTVPKDLYGIMKINYNFSEKVKWTFQKNN